MADVCAGLVQRHRAAQRLPFAQAAAGKDHACQTAPLAHRVRVHDHGYGQFGNHAAGGFEARVQLGFLAGDRVRRPAAGLFQRFFFEKERAAELRRDALPRAAEVVFVFADDLAVLHVQVLADAGAAVVAARGHGHHGLLAEARLQLHVAVQKQHVFALRLLRADKAAQPRGGLFLAEQKAARAAGLRTREAVVRRMGIDIDDLVCEHAQRRMDALHAPAQALALVSADDNHADHRSSLPQRNML